VVAVGGALEPGGRTVVGAVESLLTSPCFRKGPRAAVWGELPLKGGLMHRVFPPSEPPDGEHSQFFRLVVVGGTQLRGTPSGSRGLPWPQGSNPSQSHPFSFKEFATAATNLRGYGAFSGLHRLILWLASKVPLLSPKLSTLVGTFHFFVRVSFIVMGRSSVVNQMSLILSVYKQKQKTRRHRGRSKVEEEAAPATDTPRGGAMAELRHATAATRATSSPSKRDAEAASASSPLVASPRDPRSPTASASYRILVAAIACFALTALFFAPFVWTRLNAPYLCRKEGIRLHCPRVRQRDSLWENPHAAATWWKPCAERQSHEVSDLVSENETSGFIFIHAEGGLNQQRIAICNAVAIAKIMNATLILPVLKQDQIWKDQTKFEDIFDVDHFINYLKEDVRIVRDIPDWFTEKDELFTSIKRTVKNVPKYASAQFYIDNVFPRIKEKKIMSIKPFVDRLGYDNVPMEINRLRCRVNYHALKFLPDIEEMADKLATRMRNRTGSLNPYMALHLRFEKGMVGLSFCDFAGTREEKAMMATYRQQQWPRRYKNGSHLWSLALEKRKEGRCPLEPGEIGIILREMGYTKETQIYVASGQVYGGNNRMAPLRNMFPNL
ncbi:hypothetical protein ACJX0J_024163, partial [Zea mays]